MSPTDSSLPGRYYSWILENPIVGIVSLLLTIGAGAAASTGFAFLLQGDLSTADSLAGIASGFATILLVGLTALYASSTRKLVELDRKDRLRPYIREIISQGIDPVIETLKKEEQNFRQGVEHSESAFPKIEELSLEDSIRKDLKRRDETTIKSFDKHQSIQQEYHECWIGLKDDLDRYIGLSFNLSGDPTSVSDFAEQTLAEDVSTQIRGENDVLSAFIEKESTALAYLVLKNTPRPEVERNEPVTSTMLANFLFDDYKTEFLNMRSHSQFEEQFRKLQSLSENLNSNRENVRAPFESMREDLFEEYDLLEAEVPTAYRRGTK